MKNKRENHLKQLKRELAQLLESGQDQTARIRVEHVVREEKTIAAYDLIDIYCELIVARLPIIESQKNCPIDLKEAVTSVVFATPRCADIPELQDVRKHFTAKYGKEFVNAALELRPDCGVSRMLVEKLSANAPDGQTKLKILTAIAEEHNVEWDPKSFGEKESKPYDDLLNGPNTFVQASKMHPETPIVQAPSPPPNVLASHGHDQKHDAPANYQHNLQSPSAHNLASSDFSGGQSVPSTTPHPPGRPSGTEYGETDRHSHSREENTFSLGGQNWDMEFKDATSAAQVAAESAERASMAARAAAELSSCGKIMKQQSNKSHKSSAVGLRDHRPPKNYDSPSEKFVKDANYDSPQDRNGNPSMRTEQIDGFVNESCSDSDGSFDKDDNSSSKKYSQSTSLKSGTASVSVDDKGPVNNFHEVDRYTQKSSFEEEQVKPENSSPLSGEKMSKQFSGEDRNSYCRSSSSDDGDDYKNSPSHHSFLFDDSEDPFDNKEFCRETIESGNINTTEAIYDSCASGDDIIEFDKHPQYDEQESNFCSASITRETSNSYIGKVDKGRSWEDTSGSTEKLLSASRVSADLFSPPQFDETSLKAPSSALPDDLGPASYDSETELGKSGFRGKSDAGIFSHKENDIFRNSDDLNEDHTLKGSYFTENNDSGSTRKQNLFCSSDDEVTGQNKHRGKGIDDVSASVSTDTIKSEVFDEVRSDGGTELKFPTLTGGLRNKGYKTPPYIKCPSGDILSSKGTAEGTPTYTQNAPVSPKVESSSLNSSVGPKTKESSYSKNRFKIYDLGTDDFEGELPQQISQRKQEEYVKNENSSSRTGIKDYDLAMGDLDEELPKPKIANKQERKEDYSKSKFSAPAGFFDPDDDYFREDLPKQTVTSKGRARSGFSRRTKANPDTEVGSYSKAKHGPGASVKPISISENMSDVSENRPKPRIQSGKHSTNMPAAEEKQKPSAMELKSTTSSGTETSKTSSGEAPSRESSLKKASHVHPKLPDYDSFAAHFQSLRQDHS